MKPGEYIRTKAIRRKISESHKGLLPSAETRMKMSKTRTGKPLSKYHKRQIAKGHLGKSLSEYHKKQVSEGVRLSDKNKGSDHYNWKGGISKDLYSVDWVGTLKRSIRERDHYTCQLCQKEPATSCHHIDYNKENCNSDNLITLCKSCHSKTNQKREYWQNYFKRRSNEKRKNAS